MIATAMARGPARIAAAQGLVLRPGRALIRRADLRRRPVSAQRVPAWPEDVVKMIPAAGSFAPVIDS